MEKGCYNYRIRPRDVDFRKQATLVALVDYVLEAAGDDAECNGFGLSVLNLRNHSWVLSRMSLEMSRIPMEYELITITTWVSEVGRMMTTRNMVITDAEGLQIGAAVTCWATIDLTSRRPMDLSTNVDYLSAIIDHPSPIINPHKVRLAECSAERDYTVVYSDVDFNHHTNTMKYLEMMLDTMPLERIKESCLQRLDLNFIHESRYGDRLTIRLCDTSKSQSIFEIVNASSEPICRAQVGWSVI